MPPDYILQLPHVNATLNGLSALLLLLGYSSIRRKNIQAHKAFMVAAGFTSTLFLACYLTYHFHQRTTKFTAESAVRYVYFTILISHTILATVNLPLILVTFYHAFRDHREKHKRLAKWAFPIWLYVSITGVVVYMMLYQIYPPDARSRLEQKSNAAERQHKICHVESNLWKRPL